WSLYEQGKQVTGAQYLLALAMVQMTGRAVGQFHERYDAWLTPTLGAPPIALRTINIEQRDVMTAFAPIIDYVPFTALQNATGQPAISLPLHWSADGLPIGVHFVGRLGEEHLLLQLAAQIEKAQPWSKKHPPIWG